MPCYHPKVKILGSPARNLIERRCSLRDRGTNAPHPTVPIATTFSITEARRERHPPAQSPTREKAPEPISPPNISPPFDTMDEASKHMTSRATPKRNRPAYSLSKRDDKKRGTTRLARVGRRVDKSKKTHDAPSKEV